MANLEIPGLKSVGCLLLLNLRFLCRLGWFCHGSLTFLGRSFGPGPFAAAAGRIGTRLIPFGGLVDFKIVLRDTNMIMHFLGGQTIFFFQCNVWTELSLIYQGLDFFSFVSSIKTRDVLQVGKM